MLCDPQFRHSGEKKTWGLTRMVKSYFALFPWFHLYCTRAHNALCAAASRLPQVRLCWKAAYKPECGSVLKVKVPFPRGRLFQSFLQNWIRFKKLSVPQLFCAPLGKRKINQVCLLISILPPLAPASELKVSARQLGHNNTPVASSQCPYRRLSLSQGLISILANLSISEGLRERGFYFWVLEVI